MSKTSKALSNPAELMKKQLADTNKRIAQSDSNRVKVNRAGFIAPGGDQGDELIVVVVDYTNVNMFYESEYDKDNITDPDCYANNRIHAELEPERKSPKLQAEVCTACPQNQWGSAPRGKGKACKNSRLLAIVPFDNIGEAPIWTISVSPTGIKRWDNYVKKLADVNLTPMFVGTKITLAKGLDYASLMFETLQKLDEGDANLIITRLEAASELLNRVPKWEDE